MPRNFWFASLVLLFSLTFSSSEHQKCIDGYQHILKSDGQFEMQTEDEPILTMVNGFQINKYPPMCCDGYSVNYNLAASKYECKSDCGECGENAHCDKTKKCICNKGSSRNSSGKCEKMCDLNCVNGFCATSNTCQCDEGFVLVGNNVCGVDEQRDEPENNVQGNKARKEIVTVPTGAVAVNCESGIKWLQTTNGKNVNIPILFVIFCIIVLVLYIYCICYTRRHFHFVK